MSRRYFIGLLLVWVHSAYADPWFTGPLLATPGVVSPLGEGELELYAFHTKNTGELNRHSKQVNTGVALSTLLTPELTYGLTDWMDTQFGIPYLINYNLGQKKEHIGDVFALLGFQIFEQKKGSLQPNFRLTVEEIFPTGRYQTLSPPNEGTDGTGLGVYQTMIGLNFQRLDRLFQTFDLQTTLNLSYLHARPVGIQGLNVYGGDSLTQGRVIPGDLKSIDLAAELSVTQNLVLVMEAFYFNQKATRFSGINPSGDAAPIGNSVIDELSFAPAIEFNFSEHYGLIAGAWFSVIGNNAPAFVSTVVAFNAAW